MNDERLNKSEITRLVKQLVGPIYPTGDTATDESRLENIKLLGDVVVSLYGEIEYVVHSCDGDNRHSVKRICEKGKLYIDAISEP